MRACGEIVTHILVGMQNDANALEKKGWRFQKVTANF